MTGTLTAFGTLDMFQMFPWCGVHGGWELRGTDEVRWLLFCIAMRCRFVVVVGFRSL